MIIGSDKRCTVAEKLDEDGELEVCIKSRDAIHIFEFIGEDDALKLIALLQTLFVDGAVKND